MIQSHLQSLCSRLRLRFRGVLRDRKGSIAVMAALMVLPMIALVGLAIDFSVLNQARSALNLAANAATLNAVKVAAAGNAASNPNYLTDGQTAGVKWFNAQSGRIGLGVSAASASVKVTGGTSITATLSGTAQVASIFGNMFGVKTYNIALTTQAVKPITPYVEVVMMLDDSSSMGIGATQTDIATMYQASACDSSNEWTTTDGNNYSIVSGKSYYEYAGDYNGAIYDGDKSPWNGPAYPVTLGSQNLNESNLSLDKTVACPTKVNGFTAYPGPPCAFACHWDMSQKAGLGNDLWAMARKNGVTLRLDVLKNAVQDVITTMKQKDQPNNTLSLGIYTFDTLVTPVYPASGEAGSDWATASSAVGLPPARGTYVDSGNIQPVSGNIDSNTYFYQDMTTLAGKVTAAGDGTSPSKPRKVLFLVTDGMGDENDASTNYSRSWGAMSTAACQKFKDIGYTVYVLYTPYYPLMNQFYLGNIMPIVEGSGAGSLSYNLQACSSSTGPSDLSTYYIQASNQTELNAALQTFLTSSLGTPARYTE